MTQPWHRVTLQFLDHGAPGAPRGLVGHLVVLVHEEHQLLSTHQEIFWCEAISLGGSRDDQRVAFLMPGS